MSLILRNGSEQEVEDDHFKMLICVIILSISAAHSAYRKQSYIVQGPLWITNE